MFTRLIWLTAALIVIPLSSIVRGRKKSDTDLKSKR